MDTAMTLNWLEMRSISTARAKLDLQARAMQLARENAHLAEENNRLRQENEDLMASAEIWIRLYEGALDRVDELRSQLEACKGSTGGR